MNAEKVAFYSYPPREQFQIFNSQEVKKTFSTAPNPDSSLPLRAGSDGNKPNRRAIIGYS
jgi:hypothetical protein